jgi:ABC-type Zn uptake system ZnuABC Zn-binding protein ZnuA
MKKIIGFVLLIGGAALIALSFYIKNQVAEGREKISSAQSQVNVGKTLFSLHPVTKEIGGKLTDVAEKKIAEGSEMAAQYEKRAEWLMIGGVGLGALGLGILLFARKKQ